MKNVFYLSFIVLWSCLSISCSQGPSSKSRNTFYRSFSAEPSMLNPISSSDLYASKIQDHVIDSLLTRDPETNEFQPGLAESWSVDSQGKTYTFKIRQGIQFTDGSPLTAEDVKFSFDAVSDPQYEAAHRIAYFQNIKSPVLVDEYTITFPVKQKYFGNLETLASYRIVPKEVYSQQNKENKMSKVLIGSGPYKIEKYNKGKNLILVKNKDWWGFRLDQKNLKKAHRFDKVIFRFVKEDTIVLELLKKAKLSFSPLSGEQFVEKVDTSKSEWKHMEKFEAENDSYKAYSFIGWNLKNDLFKEKKVRQALAHLMNRELIRKKFQYGKSYLTLGPWYPQSMYADKSVQPILFDLQKASQLFKESGWKDSDQDGVLDKIINGKKQSFRFTLFLPNRDVEKYFTVYKEDLKKAGVNMSIKNIDWNSFVKALNERKFEAVTLAWGGAEEDVDIDPKQIWHTESIKSAGSNFISYSNKKVDRLIDQARLELDRKKRIPILKKVYSLIAEDAPYLFLFSPKVMYVVDKKIKREKVTYKYTVGLKYWTLENSSPVN